MCTEKPIKAVKITSVGQVDGDSILFASKILNLELYRRTVQCLTLGIIPINLKFDEIMTEVSILKHCDKELMKKISFQEKDS